MSSSLAQVPGLEHFESWFDIFGFRLIVDQQQFENLPGPYVFALAPHGVVPLAGLMSAAYYNKCEYSHNTKGVLMA